MYNVVAFKKKRRTLREKVFLYLPACAVFIDIIARGNGKWVVYCDVTVEVKLLL